VSADGASEGWFDAKKLERAFQNLLLNACEATPRETGRIEVRLRRSDEQVNIFVEDNGSGIAEAVRDKLFEPFVSYGKENGTGMGLTVVQKIVQDHGGDVTIEHTSSAGTIFKVTLPLSPATEKKPSARVHA
jgi:signal transduction histidine kinase